MWPWDLHCLQPWGPSPVCPPETWVLTPLHQGCTPPEGMPGHGRAGSPERLQSIEPTGGTWKGVGRVVAKSWGFFLNNNLVPQFISALPACKPACIPSLLEEPSSSKLSGKRLINPHSPTACPEGPADSLISMGQGKGRACETEA